MKKVYVLLIFIVAIVFVVLDFPTGCSLECSFFPEFKNKLDQAKRIVNKYLPFLKKEPDLKKCKVPDFRLLTLQKTVWVANLTEKEDSWQEDLGLKEFKSESYNSNKEIVVVVAENLVIGYPLKSCFGQNYVIVFLGRKNQDISFATFNCYSCLSTKEHFNSSVDKLLLRLLVSYISNLALSLNFVIRVSKECGKIFFIIIIIIFNIYYYYHSYYSYYNYYYKYIYYNYFYNDKMIISKI